MSKVKKIFFVIFSLALAVAILSDIFDLSGKRSYKRECKIHPWTCEK